MKTNAFIPFAASYGYIVLPFRRAAVFSLLTQQLNTKTVMYSVASWLPDFKCTNKKQQKKRLFNLRKCKVVIFESYISF